MLGLGWTEMLVIGVVALIVIGPKDLPVVMNKIGKVAGQIRRMGNEFQREINKTTGLDEVRNLRNSITAPLKKTSEDIRREFNTITPTGQKPSGIIKPADPKVESVVDEIKAAAGMTPAKPEAVAVPVKAAPVKARKVPAKATPAPTSPVTSADLAPVEETKPVKAPAKPRKPAAPKAEAKADVAKPVAAKATTRKAPAARKAAVTDGAEKPKPAPRKRAAPKPKAPATTPDVAEDK